MGADVPFTLPCQLPGSLGRLSCVYLFSRRFEPAVLTDEVKDTHQLNVNIERRKLSSNQTGLDTSGIKP